jgi:hypothetical protein
MTSTITIGTIRTIRTNRLVATAATIGLLTLAAACGTAASTDGSQVEPAPAPVVQHGSPDSIERKLAAQVVVPDGSPDSIERRLAATRGEASCRVSADTAERLGINACAR